jgi:hypothetical protein
MSGIEIIAVIGLIGYIIFRQVQGEPLRGKRAVVLPAILTIIGFVNLRSGGGHLGPADIFCLAIGTAGSAAIGLAFGAITRLESRGGYLWAQLPLRGLWLWAALVGWRVLVMLVATGMHAHVAASTATLLLSLGINRLAQAGVIVPRAMRMGIPFAPEKDGKVFMADTFNRGGLGNRSNERFSSNDGADFNGSDGSDGFNGGAGFNGSEHGNGHGSYDRDSYYNAHDRRNAHDRHDRHDRRDDRSRRRDARRPPWDQV